MPIRLAKRNCPAYSSWRVHSLPATQVRAHVLPKFHEAHAHPRLDRPERGGRCLGDLHLREALEVSELEGPALGRGQPAHRGAADRPPLPAG